LAAVSRILVTTVDSPEPPGAENRLTSNEESRGLE